MRATTALLLGTVLLSGCNELRLPTPPSKPPAPGPPAATALTVTGVFPAAGWPFYYQSIVGTGFVQGVRVTHGGLNARVIRVLDSRIDLWPEWQAPGVVDVTVTNPDGTSVTLANGFTLKAATLVLDKSVVAPGEPVTVTWRGPHDPSDFAPCDLIGLYRVSDSSNTTLWDTCSGVGEEFSEQFKAPSISADYEVRYHMMRRYLLARVPLTVR